MNMLIVAAALTVVTGPPLAAGSGPTPVWLLPEERQMTAQVKEILGMIGLHNDVSVVVDRDAAGCAYATNAAGRQYIGVDPACVGPLKNRAGKFNWRAIGILLHEIAHLISGHTTSGKGSNPVDEAYADEWVGWAMFRLHASVEQAQTFFRTTDVAGSGTHPARIIRLEAVLRGWKKSEAGLEPTRRKRPLGEWWAELMTAHLPWPWPEK